MRHLLPDGTYFDFLDSLRDERRGNTVLAPTALMEEFPNLNREEAKSICADWRARVRSRGWR